MGVVVASAAIATISYYISRVMKGSMKLSLSQKSVNSGEKITGHLRITSKKPLTVSRMYIVLIGEREDITRKRRGTRRSWVEFYRHETELMKHQNLHAGFREIYEFDLDVPATEQLQSEQNMAIRSMATAKQIVEGADLSRKRWKVISRLETKGVDLAASQKIHVSLKSAV